MIIESKRLDGFNLTLENGCTAKVRQHDDYATIKIYNEMGAWYLFSAYNKKDIFLSEICKELDPYTGYIGGICTYVNNMYDTAEAINEWLMKEVEQDANE